MESTMQTSDVVEQESTATAQSAGRILIVDDLPANVRLLAGILTWIIAMSLPKVLPATSRALLRFFLIPGLILMPLVFGGAPLVNVLYTMYLHPPKAAPNPLLYVGFLVTALGAGMVLYFKPPAH